MIIKAIVIEGENGDVTVQRVSGGAVATTGGEEIARFAASDPHEARYAAATRVAAAVYGRGRGGRVAATNSMVHDVLAQLDRVAGC